MVYSSEGDGLAPLLDAIERLGSPALAGSTVVDKIVGKAVALLACYFRAFDVYAEVMSRRAVEVLTRHGVKHSSEEVVEEIRDREGKGVCPFERLVLDVDDPRQAYERLLRIASER